jgi:2-phosphosulfolactate phosphatase
VAWDDQDGFAVRFDWGVAGVARLAPHVDAIVVVDVLRFTTAVETAVTHGLAVHPYRWHDDGASAFARSFGAVLADGTDGAPTLCPRSLRSVQGATAVVLPSPNGSTCAVEASASGTTVVAACLRNAGAVARWVNEHAGTVGVIGCGELPRAQPQLLPAIEDLLGASAVLEHLAGERSPEAIVAAAALPVVRDDLPSLLAQSSSGRFLVERDHADDVAWAAQLNVSECVPVLRNGAFVPA